MFPKYQEAPESPEESLLQQSSCLSLADKSSRWSFTGFHLLPGRPEAMMKKQKGGPKWEIVEYSEPLKASSVLSFEAAGQLLWRRQWLESAP